MGRREGSRKKTDKGEPIRQKENRRVCVLKPGEEIVSRERSGQWTVPNVERPNKMRTDHWIRNVRVTVLMRAVPQVQGQSTLFTMVSLALSTTL